MDWDRLLGNSTLKLEIDTEHNHTTTGPDGPTDASPTATPGRWQRVRSALPSSWCPSPCLRRGFSWQAGRFRTRTTPENERRHPPRSRERTSSADDAGDRNGDGGGSDRASAARPREESSGRTRQGDRHRRRRDNRRSGRDIYGTDPTDPDTDGDGYADGMEVACGGFASRRGPAPPRRLRRGRHRQRDATGPGRRRAAPGGLRRRAGRESRRRVGDRAPRQAERLRAPRERVGRQQPATRRPQRPPGLPGALRRPRRRLGLLLRPRDDGGRLPG